MDTPFIRQSMLCVVYVQGASKYHPNTWGHLNIWGCPSIQRAPKHRGHPNIQGHPNIWGHPNIQGAFKYMRYPNLWGHPNVWGIWTPLSLTKHAFFVLCMYRGHPNIWGTPIFGCLRICVDTTICLDTPTCLDAPCTSTTQRKHPLSH